jgi:hypothetical protein
MNPIFMRFRKPIYLVDSWTLQDFYQQLVKGPCEEIFYATGPHLDNLRILSRMCALEYEKQSPVYVRATRKSSVDALIEMTEHENQLHLVAHSHPGCGAFATSPSWTDVTYLGKLQKTGAETIAMIVSRDGFLRFWTVFSPFKLIVRGSGITEVKGHKHVYQLQIPEADCEQSCEVQGQPLLSF